MEEINVNAEVLKYESKLQKNRKDIFGEDNFDTNGQLIIPVDIQRPDAYIEYLVTKADWERLVDSDPIKTSDSNLQIKPKTPLGHVKRMIQKLPKKEQNTLIKHFEKVSRLMGSKLGLYNRAYGAGVVRDDSLTDSIIYRRRFELIDYFSRFYSIDEVWRIVKEEWKTKVPKVKIIEFRQKYITEIKVAQEEYKNNFDEIRLVYKRSRLDELLELYNDRRTIYITTKDQNDYRLLLQTLEQIRKEVEGERVNVDATMQIEIEQNVSIHQEEVMRELPIKSLIVSMVSAKMGINPLFLMHKLQHSYYAQYTGFGMQEEAVDITHPSTLIYNMDEIRAIAKAKDRKEKENQSVFPEIEEAEIIKLNNGKQTLLEEIRDKKEKLKRDKVEHDRELLKVEQNKTKTGKAIQSAPFDDKAKRSSQVGRKKRIVEDTDLPVISDNILKRGNTAKKVREKELRNIKPKKKR